MPSNRLIYSAKSGANGWVMAEDRWVEHEGVRLHYLDSQANADQSMLPIVFVPVH